MSSTAIVPIEEEKFLFPKPAGNFLVVDMNDLNLSEREREEVDAYQLTLNILGPAGGACLICPGNQLQVPEEQKCPYSAKCPLLRVRKAPAGKLCPIERTEIENRFSGWCKDLGASPLNLSEMDRITASDLTWIDLQIQRCNHILDKGAAARLTIDNVRETDPETGIVLSWEKVIHPITELLASLQLQRRAILKDCMLTREQQWKKDRAENKSSGKDLTSQQSARADKIRGIGIQL